MSQLNINVVSRIKIDEPLWDQSTYVGRFKHFMWVTDFRTCIATDQQLYDAKTLVEQYRNGREPYGTTREEVIYAKKLFESAFHPDTGDLQNALGRMSFQVPGGMIITGAMLQWYRTIPAVVFWQWTNQSLNAFTNYTNRNAKSPITTTQLVIAYVSATSSALAAAIGFKQVLGKRANPFFQRYVPFVATAVANCVNIPLMRQSEILYGVDVQDENGNIVCQSKLAAVKGISQVVISRIFMCMPGMTILPVVMERLEKYPWMQRIATFHGPIQILAIGCFLVIMVPAACALFPQRCSLKTSTLAMLEPDSFLQIIKKGGTIPIRVYFNKGL